MPPVSYLNLVSVITISGKPPKEWVDGLKETLPKVYAYLKGMDPFTESEEKWLVV